jgi:hypothetical protein
MSWGGVTVIWPMEGQTDAEAIGAHFGLEVTLDPDGDHTVEARPGVREIPEPGPASDALLRSAREAVTSVSSQLADADPPRRDPTGYLMRWSLTDELGQIMALTPGTASLWPGRDARHDQFARLWQYVVALSTVGRPVVWEGDDDVLVDTSLSLEQARGRYLWC